MLKTSKTILIRPQTYHRWVWAAAVVAIAAGILINVQYRTIRRLREENASLREQGEAMILLLEENRSLSNRLAKISPVEASVSHPPLELLRLRGRVGVLTREVEELRDLTNVQEQVVQRQLRLRLAVENEKRLQSTLIASRADYARTKTQLDTLNKLASDREAMVRTLAATVDDRQLSRLLEEKDEAVVDLSVSRSKRGVDDPRTRRLANKVADVQTRIERRSQGILAGMKNKIDSTRLAIEELQGQLDNERTGGEPPH